MKVKIKYALTVDTAEHTAMRTAVEIEGTRYDLTYALAYDGRVTALELEIEAGSVFVNGMVVSDNYAPQFSDSVLAGSYGTPIFATADGVAERNEAKH